MIGSHSNNDEIDPLTRIAIKHGTDKWGPHFYTPVYHNLFSHLRDRPLRLLEIGVGGYEFRNMGGASLQMWAEYFPAAEITAIEISEKHLDLDPRIRIYRGSQDDPKVLRRVCKERGPFDIIIDDGSHNPRHVVASFVNLIDEMAKDGVYVIEDVQTTYWPNFGGSLKDGGETMKLARTLIDYLHHTEIAAVDRSRNFPQYAKQIRALRVYRNLIVIEKGDNLEPSYLRYDLKNPVVSRGMRLIEQELERSPTANGLANLITLYTTGGDLSQAQVVADRALEKWSDNPAVLFAAFMVAVQRKDAARRITCLEGLLRLEPDSETLREALVQARGEQMQPPSA
jgi:hypothetical protein